MPDHPLGSLRPKPIRMNAEIRRGLTLIHNVVLHDFDNGFEETFPEANDKQILELTAAMQWLEQYINDDEL